MIINARDVIESYISKHRIPKVEFARKAKITYQFLWLILKKHKNIGANTALAIEKATNGEIKKEWLVFPQEYRKEIEEYLKKGA